MPKLPSEIARERREREAAPARPEAPKRDADSTLVDAQRNETGHNCDRSPADDHRNAGKKALTNAERQRRYRNKKRGGPPLGRWHGHASIQRLLASHGLKRTMAFMGQWIIRLAPDRFDSSTGRFDYGEYGSLTALYRGLKRERLEAAAAFCQRTNGDYWLARGWTLLDCPRRNGRFAFRWAKKKH